jgi:hypothetical protein
MKKLARGEGLVKQDSERFETILEGVLGARDDVVAQWRKGWTATVCACCRAQVRDMS